MIKCPKCQRVLPPNMQCPYCGKLDVEPGSHKPTSPWAVFAGKLVKLAIAAMIIGGAYYLVFTPAGQRFLKKVQGKLGLSSTSDDSPAVQLLKMEVPAIMKLPGARPGMPKFDETKLDEELIQVTVLHQNQDDFLQATFRVDLIHRTVEPQDAEAIRLMNE